MANESVQRSYKETISHYESLRKVAHEFTEEEYRSFGISMSEIRYSDTVEADKWQWGSAEKTPIWEWTRMYRDYHSHTGVKRFDTALFAQGKLCALCYGVPSRGKLILKLHALSRAPRDNPLAGKILSIMLFAANAYARLIGAKEMWLCEPMNESLVTLYEKQGYTAHRNNLGKTTHLSMRLD